MNKASIKLIHCGAPQRDVLSDKMVWLAVTHHCISSYFCQTDFTFLCKYVRQNDVTILFVLTTGYLPVANTKPQCTFYWQFNYDDRLTKYNILPAVHRASDIIKNRKNRF